MDKLIELLKSAAGVADWKLVETKNSASELYYVGRKLETNRASDVSECEVTVYTDSEGKRGASTFTVYPYMGEAELSALIADNVFAAGFAGNPWYPLPEPGDLPAPESTNMEGRSLKEMAEETANAVFAGDCVENCYLSATEVFIDRTETRIRNSRGIDVSSVSYKGSVELIPTCTAGAEETEIYRMLRFDSLEPAEITASVAEYLQVVLDRSRAQKLSDVIDLANAPKVILQDDEAGAVFARYFASDLSYEKAFQKVARSAPGASVQSENRTGTPLTLTMAPAWKNAVASAAFDADGVVLRPVRLITEGKVEALYGDARFGSYLGVEHPTGKLPITVVEPGTKTFAEMASEPYLRCKVLSGIQIEGNSGYLGGEIRLGYYFDGEKEIPVTGFSISGNLKEAVNTMVYSAEETTGRNYHGPKYLEIRGMKLA